MSRHNIEAPDPKRREDVTYWAAASINNGGTQRVLAAVKILAEWEDTRTVSPSPTSESASHDATLVVDRDIVPGSIFWRGAPGDLPATGRELYQATSFREARDQPGRFRRREVGLMRFHGTLPDVVAS